MYWRTSKLDVENNPLRDGEVLPELYLNNDDYALFIKFEEGERHFPWCIMRPFGTKYGSDVVEVFSNFSEAFKRLKEMSQEGS
jgi:hypothetical protein